MKTEQIKEITDKATEQLVAALNAGHSETLTGYLKAIGRFHRYSLHNVLLIASQKPDASYVAGFRTWNQLGRFLFSISPCDSFFSSLNSRKRSLMTILTPLNFRIT